MTELQEFHSVLDLFFASFKKNFVVVTNNQVHASFGHIGIDSSYPDVTFSTFSVFRSLHSVEAIYQISCNQSGIYEHAFCRHGMSSDAFDVNFCTACVEGFVNNFTLFAAVNGVCKIHREFFKVDCFSTKETNFFVRNEANINVTVVNGFVVCQSFESYHNVSNRSFVVSTQNGSAIANNNVLTNVLFNFRMFAYFKEDLFFFVQADVATLIVFHNVRMNVCIETNIYGIKMSYPTNCRNCMMTSRKICRKLTGQNREFADFQINQAKLCQFSFQKFCQFTLTASGRNSFYSSVTLAGNSNITQETFK